MQAVARRRSSSGGAGPPRLTPKTPRVAPVVPPTAQDTAIQPRRVPGVVALAADDSQVAAVPQDEQEQERNAHTPWWKAKSCASGMLDIESLTQLQLATSSGNLMGRSVVIELFAGSCRACRHALPKLCALAQVGSTLGWNSRLASARMLALLVA
jgi:hypothetical protein